MKSGVENDPSISNLNGTIIDNIKTGSKVLESSVKVEKKKMRSMISNIIAPSFKASKTLPRFFVDSKDNSQSNRL